ncbi:MAG: DUF2283 domain-containing protein [Dehalococcoidia bacterium]|nr:DUF2283 domain-containing protein [Dehalococcoidia bacterium]
MELTHDVAVDAVYVRLSAKPRAGACELDERRILDVADDGSVTGVELLYVSNGVDVTGLPRADEIASLLEEHAIPAIHPSRP